MRNRFSQNNNNLDRLYFRRLFFFSSLMWETQISKKNKHLIKILKVTANKIVIHPEFPCSVLVFIYTQIPTMQYRIPSLLTHNMSLSCLLITASCLPFFLFYSGSVFPPSPLNFNHLHTDLHSFSPHVLQQLPNWLSLLQTSHTNK